MRNNTFQSDTWLSEDELQKIQHILVEVLHVEPGQITPGAAIVADLGADSLDVVDITMKVEETFDVSVPDDSLEKVQTVGDLCELTARLLGRRR